MTEHHCEARKEDDLCEIFQDTISTSMLVKEVITPFVILTCLIVISTQALPYSQRNRDGIGADSKRNFKDVSPGWGGVSQRKPNGSPSRSVPSHGSPRSAAHGLSAEQKNLGRRSSRRDVFTDFYEAKNDKAASYRHDDELDDDAEDGRCLQDDGNWSFDRDLMKNLIGILQTGKIGQNHEKMNKARMVSGHNFMRTLSPVTRQGTFLEIGTGVTSLHLAASEKMQSLVTSLIIPEPDHKKLLQMSKSYNAFIGSVSSKDINSLLTSLVQDPEVFFGSILLSNLTALIGDNLPHEFEKLLGQVFLLAKETYLSAPSTDRYTASYMHSWSSVQNMAERACSSLDVTCAISAVAMDSWDLPTLTKVTLIEGQRPLTRQYCCGETMEDCSMTYRTVNGTEDITVGASQHKEVRFQRTGLLLSTLLRLNLVGSSLERLIVPLLEMDYNPERIARNILVTNKHFMIHSELPSCQSLIYENDKTQQGRDVANILSGAKEQSAKTIDEKMPLQRNRYAENINGNVKDTSGIESRQNSVLQSQQSNDQNLIMNMHTMYANKAGENSNMHAMYANDGLNMHNEYADGNGVKDRLRSVEGSQKLTFQGNEERQLIGRVGRRSSAIKNNQRAFKGEEQKLDFADMNSNNVGLQKGPNLADTKMNDMGLQNGMNMMQRRPRNAVGWTGDEEGDQREHDRPMEWERTREELDRSQGVRQQALKSQVDMVADLWQRETEDASDAKRKPEVPGSNWDRETDSRSSHDPSASKLVAVGNLLLTRDEANPPVQEKSWEIMKEERRQEGQTRKNKNDEGAAMQELDAGGRRKVSEKQESADKLVSSRNGMENRRLAERSNSLGRQQPLKPPPGVAGGGKDSKIASDDSHASANKVRDSSIKDNGLPVSDKGKASRGGRFPKQRRKQFRQALDSMQGGIREDDAKSTAKIRGSSIQQPLTPSERVTVRRATETGEEKRDDKTRAIDALPYQQRRQLLHYYDNDFAYNAEGKMRSDTIDGPKEDQQELDARRRMMESIARQQEQGGEPRWEELESNIEEMDEGDVVDDYYEDGVKMEDDVKEGAPNEDVEDYDLPKEDGPIPRIIPHEKDEDGWREDAFQTRHLGPEDDDSHGDAREDEDEEEEIGRMMKEMLKVKETEGEKIFDSMWQVLEGVFFDEETREFSLMTYGGKELSLLSAKVSRSYPNSSILTIIPAKDDQLIGSHRKLQESLQLTNNIITQSELSDRIVFSLYQQMEYFRFQVLGLATFQKLVTYGSSFPSFLGHLLALSRTTFIQVPHPVTLASLQVLLHSSLKDKSGDSIYKGFLSASLEEAGVLDYSITVLNKVYLQNHARLVRVDIHAFYRQVTMDCSGSLAYFKQDASKPVSLAPLRSAAAGDFPIQTMGGAIRLQSLLSLGLLPNERKLLFREYLKLAVHSDMCPMTILWQRGRLLYSPIIDSTIENPDQHIPCADDRRALVETMTKQLDMRPFSFMEYGTGRDGLSITLATKYPNSTFILVTGSEKGAETRQDDLDRKNISNTVVTSMGADMSFASNLVSSPDFMRYQYIGVNQLFSMMIGYQQSMLQSMLGDIISSGVTTFLQMPSAQMLSLAVSTLFPEVLCDFKETEVKMDIFLASKHPLHGFKNYELKLMKENIQVQSGQANLSASMIHPLPNPDGSQLGWSMVRVDVRQLEIMVDHHFMYALDGHQRKYYLHCNSNATHYEVYLIRAHDGFKIPYQEVKGISLIALLRMGLLPQIKENFYNQFLKLPLYGDMAPWNILFSGGKLEYIDYDTKQMTLDKVAPAAYQIMAMLMNYKRTVEDFGHCNFNGRNPYGFDLVSHCVGSNYEGSCTDERFPVACADQSCRANYIECLRALSEIEQKHSGIKAVGSAESRSLSNTKQDEETLTTEIGERLELSFKGQSGTGRMDFYRKR